MSKSDDIIVAEYSRKKFKASSSSNLKICVCCLSGDGSFVNLKSCEHVNFFSSIPGIMKDIRTRIICRECHSLLRKFTLFRKQVERNIKLLNNQTTNPKTSKIVLDLKCTPTEVLSTLSTIPTVADTEEPNEQDESEIIAIKSEPDEYSNYENNDDDAIMEDEDSDDDVIAIDMETVEIPKYDNVPEASKKTVEQQNSLDKEFEKVVQTLKSTKRLDKLQGGVSGSSKNRLHQKSLDIEFENVVQTLQSARRSHNIQKSDSQGDTQTSIRAIALKDHVNSLIQLTEAGSSDENVSTKVAHLTETIKIMQQIILTLSENQQDIMFKLEDFPQRSDQKTVIKKTIFKPIDSEEELKSFENRLRDDKTEDDFIKKLNFVCGEGKGRGINNAYKLIDIMFCRKFLTQCSWSGGSRQETQKVCFKAFRRTLYLFFTLINNSDKTFTLDECELFFKNILKNSTKRSISKQLRRSAARSRKNKNVDRALGSETEKNNQES